MEQEISLVSLERLIAILNAYEDSLDWRIDDEEMQGLFENFYEQTRNKLLQYINAEVECIGSEKVRNNLSFYAGVTEEEISALKIII